MPPAKIDSRADEVEAAGAAGADQRAHGARRGAARTEQGAAGPHRGPRGQARQAAEDAGQLFAAAVAQSEGERRGGDTCEESPQRPSWRGASACREPRRDTRHLRRALRVRRRARRGRPGTREGLGPCRSAADQADHDPDQSVPRHLPLLQGTRHRPATGRHARGLAVRPRHKGCGRLSARLPDGRLQASDRKIREMIVAARLETSLTKDEILELYLNCVYLGRSAWGIEVASQSYFGKPAKQLTLE